MKSQRMLITPDLAKEWLKKAAANRPIRDRLVRKYAADMKADRWRLTHQGIAFNVAGELTDGRHRLSAVIESETPIESLVFFDCTDDAIRSVDIGGARTVGNQLDILGIAPHASVSRVAAVARSMLAGMEIQPSTISNDIILQCVEKYGELIAWTLDAVGPAVRKAPVYAVITKAVIMRSREELEPFCTSLRDNIHRERHEPANVLQTWLGVTTTSKYKSAKSSYARTVTAVRAFLHGKKLKNLNPSSIDIGLEDLIYEFCEMDDEESESCDSAKTPPGNADLECPDPRRRGPRRHRVKEPRS